MRRSKTGRTRTAILAGAAISTMSAAAFAQTSGSWIVNADGNWSDPLNWAPAIPDGGGVATFNQLLNQNATRNTTVDVNVTVGELLYNSAPRWIIPAAGAGVLTVQGLGASPGVLTSNISAPNSPSAFSFGPTISRPILGANGLTKAGPGNLTLTGTNTFTGGVNMNAGMLLSTSGDAALGTGGAANAINFNGGIWLHATAAVTSARNVNIAAGGATIGMLSAGTHGGVWAGSGNLNKLFSGNMAFQAANTYTGASNFQADGTASPWGQLAAGTVFYQANGTALTTSAITASCTITLDNATTNINGRLNPAAAILYHGGALTVTGNAAVSTAEAVAGVTGDAGMEFFTVTPNLAQAAQLTMASFTRANRSTQIYRGTGLGNTPGVGVGNIFLTAAPTLFGGGGPAGSQNISIIQGAVGGVVSTSAGTDMVTYGATGVRPLSLAALEYRTTLGAGAATDNVRLAAATVTAADETMNSLVIAAGALTGTNTLTLTSGMLINSAAATHAASFNFGTAEGVIHNTALATYSGVISGSNGITRSGTGAASFNGANTYTGATTLLAGQTNYVATTVAENTAGPFGNSSDPIIIEPGGGQTARLWFSGTGGAQFDRDVIARGSGAASAGFGVSGSQTITMNGDVVLERQLDLEGSSTGLFDFNGVISGPGRLTDRFSNLGRFNAANTFSGGIEINAGAYYAGNDSAFGTGRIWVVGAGATVGASGAPRTIANPLTMMNNLAIGNNAAAGGGQNITFSGPVDLSGIASIQFSVPAPLIASFSGVMSNGAVVKAGTGTMRLTNANTYIGGTIVNAGVLHIDNTTGSATGPGNVQVNAATLKGDGTIGGAVTVAGTGSVAPGDSAGTLRTGQLILTDLTNVLYELGTPNIVGGGVNDLMIVNGNLTLDGVLSVTDLGGFGLGIYTLMQYSGALTDNTMTINPLPGGLSGFIDTTLQPGSVLLVVPEPGTLGLVSIAALAGLARRRRQR